MRYYFFTALILMLIAGLVTGINPIQTGQAANLSASAADGGPRISAEIHHDQSAALRDLAEKPVKAPDSAGIDLPYSPLLKPTRSALDVPQAPGHLLAPSSLTLGSMSLPLSQWDGIGKRDGVLPPDTNGDVGPNHYVQWVNLSLAIWDKQGNLLYGPVTGNTLWAGFGGPCETRNNGDPIVLYDSLADRWLASQFMIVAPYYQCIAISATPDPSGAWNRYAFQWSTTKMNDYPKFGVWPDGYYMSVNQFAGGGPWAGGGVAVFERERMLQNLPARMISFDLFAANPNFGGMLPADLDGNQAPPVGAPNPFVEWDDSTVMGGSDALRLWEFHTDWITPASSTFGANLQPDAVIATANVNPRFDLPSNWVTQPGSFFGLDPISDRLMYRLQYRNFGDRQVLVSNHTVDAGDIKAGIHWFELRKSGAGNWSLYQEGLHAPDSTQHRWMGSIAMDASGNLALGYSLSGSTTYPSIAYAGRLFYDPPGTLPQSEVIMTEGRGSQLGSSRWGDYSMMAVDPADDCTFWYTQEYYAASSSTNWKTSIGSFKFPGCSQTASGALQGTVRSGGLPVSGAKVESGGSAVFTGSDGTYLMVLPAGTAQVTASAFALTPQTKSAEINQASTTTLDFDLTTIPLVQVSGNVSDGSDHMGMPLYARLDIAGVPASPILTDPQTGQYLVDLPQGVTFQFNVSAVNGGYQTTTRAVTPPGGGVVEDFSMSVDPVACPLGYVQQTGTCQVIPGGLVVGWVRDANQPPNPSPRGLPGTQVSDTDAGITVTAGANPPGLFFLFTTAGTRSLTAWYPGYAARILSIPVLADQAAAQNFDLPAGYLQVLPQAVNVTVDRVDPLSIFNLDYSNLGSVAGAFSLTEFSGPAPANASNGPFAGAGRRLSPKRIGELTAQNIYEYIPPAAGPWPGAGEVLRTWAVSGLAAPWGLGVNPNGEIWIGDALSGGGDGRIHRFSMQGEPAGTPIAVAWDGTFSADLAYDPLSQRFWQVNAGGDDCMYEIDPQVSVETGVKICPALGNSQRGLAYDPRSQTFYSGSWNDAILNHFDRSGLLLDSMNIGINIAGLAYHPASAHLFVLSNSNLGPDVYVLDAHNGYSILGGFDLAGMTDFGQAGLEFDADGNLWAVDLKGRQVLQVKSGEGALLPLADVPWLQESPLTAIIQPGGSQPVSVTLDGSGLAPGLYQAYLNVTTDTPYDNSAYKIPAIPVNLTVAPAHAVSLSPAAQVGPAPAGKTFVYQVTVNNSGDTVETYSVQLGAHTWTSSVPASVGPVAAGGTLQLAVSVTVPAGTPVGQFETLTISVEPPGKPSARRSVSVRTVSAWTYIFPFVGR